MAKEKEKVSVTIGIPINEFISAEFFKHFIPMFAHTSQNYTVDLITLNGLSTDIARNAITSAFLQRKSDYLLLLNPDTVYPHNLVDLLIKSDKDVVSALSFTTKKVRPTFMLEENGKYIPGEKIGTLAGTLDVGAIGLDCCLLKREVLEKIDKKNKDKPFFQNEYRTREDLVSEEIYFSELVKKAGYKLSVDTTIVIGKVGSIAPEAIFRQK